MSVQEFIAEHWVAITVGAVTGFFITPVFLWRHYRSAMASIDTLFDKAYKDAGLTRRKP